jgi:hypothetical protein
MEHLLLHDVNTMLATMNHLTAHVLPLTIIPVIIGGFIWSKTRK